MGGGLFVSPRESEQPCTSHIPCIFFLLSFSLGTERIERKVAQYF
jgi:hypothetical protein